MDNNTVEQPLQRFRISWWTIAIAAAAAFVAVAYLIAGPLQMPTRELAFAPLALVGAVATFLFGTWKSSAVRPAARLTRGFGWMAVWIVFLMLPIGIRAGMLYKRACELPVPPGATQFDRAIDWGNSAIGQRYLVWAMLPPDDPRADSTISDFCRQGLERRGWRLLPWVSLRIDGGLYSTYQRGDELLQLSISYYDDGTMLVVQNVIDPPREHVAIW